jgi:hypothetical protein
VNGPAIERPHETREWNGPITMNVGIS